MAVLGQGQPALLVKVVMAGESCVGKTSIVRSYTEPGAPACSSSYLATIGIDFKVKPITLNDTRVKLQIWDTAGQERFHTLSTSYFRGAQGFVLVYDITNMDSFQGITSWMKDIHEKAGDEVDVILLGNKCDKESERVVPKRKGEKLAWEHGIHFFETSAKDNVNIEDAFSLLTKEILEKVSSECAYCEEVTCRWTKQTFYVQQSNVLSKDHSCLFG
ncbi:ras-related protein Rab-10 isoform X1 [Anas platyrhynchos]|uniref:ras-related protein Rab-10 isoform X1 n=1 Tax=Anas platyrhynchos TaxID=8839 RepID=UPI000F7C5A06|nr:ras-related protein Rab-10 isoform X1 [Anas platyrhynchos]|eukprot:XP_027307974.1 ras-related protein Rab-10 isoform X1 [Anas platyrhynchos]